MSRFIQIVTFTVAFLAVSVGCENSGPVERNESDLLAFDCGNGFRYPTTVADFQNVYADRPYGAWSRRGDHLGRDIDYDEGVAIHPIACGLIRVYRASDGYGTLVAVVEHRLTRPVTVHTAANAEQTIDRFISIYGHIRSSSLIRGAGTRTGLREGDTVGPDQIIGYIEHADERPGHEADDLNGHGDTHLHLGIRLQSYAEASRVHPSSPFRGYDVSGDGDRYFANPAIFMDELMNEFPILWHPPGTLLVNREDRAQRWLVGAGDTIYPVDETYLIQERLVGREVEVSPAELDCYHRGSAPSYETWLSTLIRFDDSPAVYESGMYRLTRERYTFISYEAFLSWGWTDARVEWWSSHRRPSFLASTTDRGFRRLRDGALVKARGSPEVSIVSEGRRLPFLDWETFVAMGFEGRTIYEVDPDVIDTIAYPRGDLITPELARLCRVPSCSGSRCDDAAPSGGGGVEPLSDDAGRVEFDAGRIEPDAGMPDAGASWSPEPEADAGTTSVDPNLVRIRLTDPRAECSAGWRIKLWLSYPAEESSRGELLEYPVSSRAGHSAISLWCDERVPQWAVFDPADGNALGSGIFAELSMGGVDFRSSTMLCTDPCNPSGGTVPIIMWDSAFRGTCPASC